MGFVRLATREEKRRARKALTSAVSRGEIERPETCQRCGGEGPTQAHHHDYAKPFAVEFLCASCHREADKEKLSPAEERLADTLEQTLVLGAALGSRTSGSRGTSASETVRSRT